jgi:hypothetical protein
VWGGESQPVHTGRSRGSVSHSLNDIQTPSGSGRDQRDAAVTERRFSATGIALIALMSIGSVLLCPGLPFGWIWLASHLESGTTPSIGPYALVFVGLPISALVVLKGLTQLDHAYARVTGYDPNNRPVHLPWLRSMRDERDSARRHTVLDVVMIISVAAAASALVVWFFLFAHSVAA